MKHIIILALILAFSGCTESEEPAEITPAQAAPALAEPKKIVAPVKQEADVKAPAPTIEAPVIEEKIVEAKEKMAEKIEETLTVAAEPAAINASRLYATCAACHGQNAEKKALNASKIIKGWDAAKIASAIFGYQDGSYGGAMKGLMTAQVINLSEAEVNALAEYIANF